MQNSNSTFGNLHQNNTFLINDIPLSVLCLLAVVMPPPALHWRRDLLW